MLLEQIPPEDGKTCGHPVITGKLSPAPCGTPAVGLQNIGLGFKYACEEHFMLGMIAGIPQKHFNEKLRVKSFEQIMGEGILGK